MVFIAMVKSHIYKENEKFNVKIRSVLRVDLCLICLM